MGVKGTDEEIDPEVAARLAKIRNRDINELQKEYMDRCLHIDWKLGPMRIYLNPFTTIVSAVIIWGFVIYCVIEKQEANENLGELRLWITNKWTWLYVGTQDVWAIFIFWLYFSKYGHIKLGREDEPEEYSDGTYFTMLFSAGVGIGLFFFGVAEPIIHYSSREYGGGYKANRYYQRYNLNVQAQDAMNVTFFHWGIHGWIVYVVIALLLALLCYRRGLPMTMRTCFYPILGDKIFGIMGDIIDIFCIICTMFGVCTSLGLGVIQLNSGLHRLNKDIDENEDVQTIIIWCITVVATISVISGIKIGIRRLSEICFGIGCLLMFIVLFADDSWFLGNLYVQSLGYYFQWIIQLGFHTDAFAQLDIAPDGKENPKWMEDWTIFYWGWWISWSPFVGMFVAKVSRGRNIKDFILYTLTLPCLYSFLWLTIFGGAALRMENLALKAGLTREMYDEEKYNLSAKLTVVQLTETAGLDRVETLEKIYGITLLSGLKSTAMWFVLMETYGDLGTFLTVISIIAIILYFVTSSDSGSLVIDCLSANGNPEPPVIQRIFWALTEGATATALLVAGGEAALRALQTVSVACGLPITFLLNWTCVAIYRALREESGEIDISDERWKYSMWDLNSLRRVKKAAISLIAPWFLLSKIRCQLDDKEDSTLWQAIYSLWFGVPFYLWIILMICEVEVDNIAYVGWAILLFFFALGAGSRGDIRRKYQLDGDMVEDFFALMLAYPLAIQAMDEQLEYGELPSDGKKIGMVEMGKGQKYHPSNDDNGVHMVSANQHVGV